MTATYLCLCNNGFIRKFTQFQRNTQMLKKNIEAVNAEDAAVADAAALAGGKDFDVSPASVKGISQGNDVAEFEDRAVASPYGEVNGVAGI